MIGTSSFFLELAGAVFPLIFLIFGVVTTFKKEPKAILLLVFSLFMFSLMDVRYYYQLQNRQILSSLNAQEIEFIKIGDKTISNPEETSPVVSELNKIRWFSPNHGGWAKTVPLVIKDKSGVENRFDVALYLRPEGGAIIEFSRQGFSGGGRWRDGYAYSEKLPEILKSINVPLSEEKR